MYLSMLLYSLIFSLYLLTGHVSLCKFILVAFWTNCFLCSCLRFTYSWFPSHPSGLFYDVRTYVVACKHTVERYEIKGVCEGGWEQFTASWFGLDSGLCLLSRFLFYYYYYYFFWQSVVFIIHSYLIYNCKFFSSRLCLIFSSMKIVLCSSYYHGLDSIQWSVAIKSIILVKW